jgi:periplasmic protein TonB
MPSFPGGQSALMTYIYKNIKYPEEAKEKGIQGRVTVRFVVTKDGSISQASVVRGVDPSLDNAVLEVLKKLPKFIPGKMAGTPVSVWYALPISFKLAD